MKSQKLPLLILVFLLFWEISNSGALRQGTEGFYLKIAQEMSQTKNYLTPSYLNEPHWSKPPLHFWLPQLGTFLGFKFNLLLARVSVLLFSFGCIYYLSIMLHRLTLKPLSLYFTTLITSFAFLKYSRIYMMEAPLALLCAVSIISFFEFFEKNKQSGFFISCACAGLSCLIKGPVSLVMIFLSTGIYLLFRLSLVNIQKFSAFVFASMLLASPWFLISFNQYGRDFYHYFFIRENLGKFSAKSYPISSVFFGFLIYAMPLSLFLPRLLKNYKQIFSNSFLFFTAICFVCFFALWLIPNQRSYHYAIPSIPFFLILILHNQISLKVLKLFATSLVVVSTFLVLLSLYLFGSDIPLARIVITFILFIYSLFVLKNRSLEGHLVALGIVLMTMINVFLPTFYRPILPDKVVQYFENREAPTVIIKHPYFIENLIHKPVNVIDVRDLSPTMSIKRGLFITSKNDSKAANISMKVLAQWPVWRRGLKINEIANALIQKDTSALEENYVLFTNDEKYFNDQI